MSSNDDAPPHKRLATEEVRSDSPTHRGVRRHHHNAPALSARARFMQELEQYATDDDDDDNSGGKMGSVVRGAGSMWQRGSVHGALPTSATSPPASDMRRAASSVQPASAFNFFFGSGDDEHNEADDVVVGDDAVRGTASTTSADDVLAGTLATSSNSSRRINGGKATPSRVGLQLLHSMHNASKPSADCSGNLCDLTGSPASTSAATQVPSAPPGRASYAAAGKAGSSLTCAQTPRSGFEVVHAYIPLSTGGFLSTASAADDTMEGQPVRIGDILSLRKPLSSVAPPLGNGAMTAPASSGAVSTASPNTAPSSPVTVPSTSAAPNGASVTGLDVEEVAVKAMGHFKNASTFTSEEQKYGRQLTPDMARLLFEVARVDQHTRSIEALFLDGTRAKVSFFEVRPAGYVERKMYAIWKADPTSRPVNTIHSNASSPTTSSAQSGAVLPLSAATPVFPEATLVSAAAWWVIPRLVRLTTEAAGDWYGKKCVVKAVHRGENRIRLTEWVEEDISAGGRESGSRRGDHYGKMIAAAPEARELIGLDGLETVVPKKGGRAMVVLGSRRGEMCTIRNRIRGPDGELSSVEVEMNRTKEVTTLRAEELCALAR